MNNHRNLLERSTSLLDNARFLTLATRSSEESWAATVNFVPLRSPLRLLWYSLRSARHSRHIAENPRIAASIFMTGLPGLGLDGAQLTGTCESVEKGKVDTARGTRSRDFQKALCRCGPGAKSSYSPSPIRSRCGRSWCRM
jgi:uncharacterized protein YhbP (UPF0306 family)